MFEVFYFFTIKRGRPCDIQPFMALDVFTKGSQSMHSEYIRPQGAVAPLFSATLPARASSRVSDVLPTQVGHPDS